jgi:hypothetical protein
MLEIGVSGEIGLCMPRVVFHLRFTQIETDLQKFVFSGACQK